MTRQLTSTQAEVEAGILVNILSDAQAKLLLETLADTIAELEIDTLKKTPGDVETNNNCKARELRRMWAICRRRQC